MNPWVEFILFAVTLVGWIHFDFGFTWNQKQCHWRRGNFVIQNEYDHKILVSSGLENEDYQYFCMAVKPKTDNELKALFKALTGTELTESGFKLSI